MEKEPTQKELAECYQPLFDLMEEEFGVICLVSDMNEIINASNRVQMRINGLTPNKQ